MRRFSLALSCFLILTWGCNGGSQPTANTPAPTNQAAAAAAASPTSEPASGDDTAKIVDMLRKETPQAQTGGLPAGHPPIDGSAAPAPAASGLPAGHPPIDGQATPSGGGAGAGPAAGTFVELQFEMPEGWEPRPVSSALRRAQYELPTGEDGESGGELVIYYFGPGEGGPMRANLDRWKGQFTTAEGAPLPADAVREESFESNGMQMTLLEVHGTYNNSMMPGAGGGSTTAENRMIAGIVQTETGPWFIKAVGPDAAIAAERENITAFLKSAAPK